MGAVVEAYRNSVAAWTVLCVMGLCRRSGLAVLLSLPVAVLCAFQIVLLYLYGESIIAIDMFMNGGHTNVGRGDRVAE